MKSLTLKQKHWAITFLLIAAASIAIRLLIHYDFDESAILYVGIPSLLTLALIYFRSEKEDTRWWTSYLRVSRDAFIIFMATSVILFEGFLCVLMFMPIFFGCVFIVWFIHFIVRKLSSDHEKTINAVVLPTLIVAFSLEGTHSMTSFDRSNAISISQEVKSSIEKIHQNLNSPITIDEPNSGMVRLFPMPYHVESNGLVEGDIHRIHYRYHRWFVTNTHEGMTELKIVRVEPHLIETQIVSDNSYLSNYMSFSGTRIELEPTTGGKTKVTLTIHYERKLDPAWYFEPLQRFVTEQMAAHLIESLIGDPS